MIGISRESLLLRSLQSGYCGWSPSSNRDKGRKPRKFLITEQEDIHTFYLASGQEPFPCQKYDVISTKSSRISTNLELPTAICGEMCLSPRLRKRMLYLTVAHILFPSCSEHQGQVVLGQAERCRQAKHKNMRSALPHWSRGTLVSIHSRRMCSLVWACGHSQFLWPVALKALSASTTASLGLCVWRHIPAHSLYNLFMELLSAGPSSCFLNLLMQSGFNLAAAAGHVSDPGETSAMALSPPAWMYLPVRLFDHVLTCIEAHLPSYCPLCLVSSERGWLSAHARLRCRQVSGV